MRRVVLESPFAGDTVAHVEYVLRCVAHALALGESPNAGYLVYPRVLDDTDPDQRDRGIAAHLAWIDVCDAVVVYRDLGCSPGMQVAIERARDLRKRIVHRWLDLGVEVSEPLPYLCAPSAERDKVELFDRSAMVLNMVLGEP